MIIRITFFTVILFLSCNQAQPGKKGTDILSADSSKTDSPAVHQQVEKKEISALPDTTSTDYLIGLLRQKKNLNHYWIEKLGDLEGVYFLSDSTSHFFLTDNWVINDSVAVIILGYSGGTSYDEYLITVKNKKEILSRLHISDEDDSDLSEGNPYYYTRHKLTGKTKIRLFKHKVTGSEGNDEKDRLVSIENWTILNSGEIKKTTGHDGL